MTDKFLEPPVGFSMVTADDSMELHNTAKLENENVADVGMDMVLSIKLKLLPNTGAVKVPDELAQAALVSLRTPQVDALLQYMVDSIAAQEHPVTKH